MKKLLTFWVLALGVLHTAHASFHLWDIEEVYSNADGSVQFVRLTTKAAGQEFLATQALTFTGPGGPHTFTFPTNLPGSATANHSFLVGTSTLQSLYGIVPDYVLPASFFAPGPGANLDFAGVDSVSLAKLPLDGVKSLNGRAGDDPPAHTAINAHATMENFAGDRFAIGVFGAFGGSYSGIITQASFAPAESGFLTVKLTPTGAFSGKLNFGVKKYTVVGKFDALGNASVNLAQGAIVLGLTLDLLNGTDQIAGTLTRPALPVLNCTLDRGVVVPQGGAAAQAGIYTLLLPPSAVNPAPQGNGFARVIVTRGGIIKATITLADGTRCAQNVPVSKNGVWPFFASLYGAKGLIVGTLNFRTVTFVSDFDGTVDWFRPANAKAATFALGFTNHIELLGAKYVAPAKGATALQFGPTASALKVDIGPTPLLTKAVSYSASNKVSVTTPGDDKLALTVKAPKGVFNGSFIDPSGNKKRKFSGVLFQEQGLAAGFFLNADAGGSVMLSAPPLASDNYGVKNGTVPVGTHVTLSNVLVTGIGADGFFVQNKIGDPGFTVEDFDGVFVLAADDFLSSIAVGDRVNLTGFVTGLDGTIAITALSYLVVTSTGEVPPLPVGESTANISIGGFRATALDAVLVQLGPATVSSVNAGANEFTVNDGAGSVIVGNYLFTANPLPTVGTAYGSVTGILSLRGGVSKVHPRAAGDLATAIPVLTSFGPQPAFIAVGDAGQPTLPNPLTVSIAAASGTDTIVAITSSDTMTVSVVGGGVTIPAGQTSAPVLVDGLTVGPATLTATLGAISLNADVQVFNGNTPPNLVSFTPNAATLLATGTREFTVTLDHPAPVGGTVVNLSVAPQDAGTLPATVTVAEGHLSASFDYTDGGTATSATLTAMLGIVSLQSSLTIQPAPDHLVINEVDYDQVGLDSGEFVEIYNPTANAVNLNFLSLVLVNGTDNTQYRRVDLAAAGSLPSHGYLIICNSTLIVDPGALRLTPPVATWPANDAIQNGAPDGLALINTLSGLAIDRFSYEGAITSTIIPGAAVGSLVEGTALPASTADGNTVSGSLARLPNGADTDNASTDWNFTSTPTPGAPNVP